MSEMNEMSCAMLADVAAELALGVLTGRERGDAIDHLDGCEACREDVRKLMATGDELLALLPLAEPPAGFETRVLDRLGLLAPGPAATGPALTGQVVPVAERGSVAERRAVTERRPVAGRRASHRRASGSARRPGAGLRGRQLLAAAAVAIAVAGAGIGGWGMRTATAPTVAAASSLTSAVLSSSSQETVGKIFAYRDSPGWIYMSVDIEHGNGTLTCEVTDANGTILTRGTFSLHDGYGWWAAPIPGSAGSPRGARLIAANGTVLATATFTG